MHAKIPGSKLVILSAERAHDVRRSAGAVREDRRGLRREPMISAVDGRAECPTGRLKPCATRVVRASGLHHAVIRYVPPASRVELEHRSAWRLRRETVAPAATIGALTACTR